MVFVDLSEKTGADTEKRHGASRNPPSREMEDHGARDRVFRRTLANRDAIGRAFRRPVSDSVSLEGGINRRDVAGTYGSPEAIGVRLVAAGHARMVLSH